jgi:hypothetical protein
MKKIMKIFSVILVGVAMTLASCGKTPFADAVREPSPEVDGPGIFFSPSTNGMTMEINSEQASFTVPLVRTNKQGAATASLTYSSADMTLLAGLPTKVSFADGADKADITITTDIAKIPLNKPFQVTVTLGDNTTPYGLDAVTFNVVNLPLWGNIQVAKYTAGAFGATFYGSAQTYWVKYQKAVGLDFYRLVDTYQPETAYEGFTLGSPDVLASELTGDRYIIIDAMDPAAVTIAKQSMGIDWGYGVMSMVGEKPGTFENNIVTIQVRVDVGDGRGGRGTDIFDFNPQQP